MRHACVCCIIVLWAAVTHAVSVCWNAWAAEMDHERCLSSSEAVKMMTCSMGRAMQAFAAPTCACHVLTSLLGTIVRSMSWVIQPTASGSPLVTKIASVHVAEPQHDFLARVGRQSHCSCSLRLRSRLQPRLTSDTSNYAQPYFLCVSVLVFMPCVRFSMSSSSCSTEPQVSAKAYLRGIQAWYNALQCCMSPHTHEPQCKQGLGCMSLKSEKPVAATAMLSSAPAAWPGGADGSTPCTTG